MAKPKTRKVDGVAEALVEIGKLRKGGSVDFTGNVTAKNLGGPLWTVRAFTGEKYSLETIRPADGADVVRVTRG